MIHGSVEENTFSMCKSQYWDLLKDPLEFMFLNNNSKAIWEIYFENISNTRISKNSSNLFASPIVAYHNNALQKIVRGEKKSHMDVFG